MNDEIIKKMESKVGRRSFLRGSGLAAAMIVGVAAASPLIGYAQEQDPQDKKKTDDSKTDDKKTDGQQATGDQQTTDQQSQNSNSSSSSDTKLDANGVEYRECPQCGGNMYQQGRTWTCENCGYSYIE